MSHLGHRFLERRSLKMDLVEQVLSWSRPQIWAKFKSLAHRGTPVALRSFAAAYHKGLQEGYGEGLADGVTLGLAAQEAVGDSTIPTNPEDRENPARELLC
jgi:hypothetical protein